MRLYPASPTGRTRTLLSDFTVLLLLILFAWMGMKAHDAILDLTSIGRGIQDSGRSISSTTRSTANAVEGAFSSAAQQVQGLPLVGGGLANALRDAPRSATDPLRESGDVEGARIVRLGVEQVKRTEQAANWVGWLIFLLPALVLLLIKVPPRVRLIVRLNSAQRALTGGPPHILAARAAYNLPYQTLRRYTKDPFGDLAAGRHEALLRALADDAGVKL